MSRPFSIDTFGCKVNTYDTGLLQQRLVKHGWKSSDSETAKVRIVNSCAVTAEATKEAARHIRRIKSKDPFAMVVVTGCAAQVDTEVFSQMPGVDLVVANSHKGQLEFLVDEFYKGTLEKKVFHSNIFRKADLEAGGGLEEGHTRAFLKIQDGCNSFCTYCVIPYARGRSRSIPIAELVEKVNELHRKGIQEVVLTGVHIGDYEDSGQRLESLVEAVIAQTTIPRIRLTSLEPVELTSRLLDCYESERMCTHFHMSIQSACDETLKRMDRQYSAAQVELSLNEIEKRVPGAFVGMDIIAGFVGETDQEFAQTVALLERTPWTRLHVFPYSERPGTRALNIENKKVSPQVIKERAKILRELSADRFRLRANQQVGETKKSLVLQHSGEFTKTLTRDYWPVVLPRLKQNLVGNEIDLKVTGYDHSNQSRIAGHLVGVQI